ncbi:MAG: sigma 54-interacting transcriptional regulator [Candidatus Binatia bacterium]
MTVAVPVALLESLPEPAFAISVDKRLLTMNGAAAALTGLDSATARGLPCHEVLRCDACGDRCPLDVALERDEAVSTFNVALTGRQGREPVRLHTAPLRLDGRAEPVGVLECVRPIGHLVGLFGALRTKSDLVERERNRTQAVLDSIGDGVVTLTADGTVAAANRAAEQLLGRGERDLVGRPCTDALGCAGGRSPTCPAVRAAAEGGVVTDFETDFRDRAGRPLPVRISVAPLRDEHGRVTGAIEAVRDRRALAAPASDPSSILLGTSPHMRRVAELVAAVKDNDATLLLEGESGTGKSLLAETIHRLGPRAKKPLVTVHCAALPEGLLESELFGHVRGAFPGAARDMAGRFEVADGGTVVLDEVGDLSPTMQAKLLRFLETHELERVGSAHTARVDVRVIATTSRDLHEAVRLGQFRTDLYYRLHALPIALPPLRERRGDLPLLVQHLLGRLGDRGIGVRTASADVMDMFLRHAWPGNVRELETTLEHAAVCARGNVIDVDALPRSFVRPVLTEPLPARVNDVERTLAALSQHEGNRSRAARALGVNRTTVWRRLRRLKKPPGPVGQA